MANLVWKQQYSAPGDEVLPLRGRAPADRP